MVPKKIKQVALYCRVSTKDQSVDMQTAELRQLAEQRGWDVVAVVEEKRSGAKLRPKREQLIADAKAGKCDAILVWKFDRWGRSMIDLVTSVTELDDAKVAFVSLKDNFDLTTSHGRLFMNLFASFAQFEREQIVDRVTAGLRHAKKHGTKSGKAIGRPRVIDQHMTEIRALASHGKSCGEIADKLSLGYGTVYRALQTVTTSHKRVGQSAA